MKRDLEQIVVIGLGKFGMSIAKLLSKYDCDVLAIDDSEVLIEEAVPYVTRAINLNALDSEALKAVGIQNFDIAIVGIGDNIESSLMIALTLKEMGIPEIKDKQITSELTLTIESCMEECDLPAQAKILVVQTYSEEKKSNEKKNSIGQPGEE